MTGRKTKKQRSGFHRLTQTNRVAVKSRRSAPVPLLPPPQQQQFAKILLIPDTHIPYEDEAAWNVMLAGARTLNGGEGPDAIVLLGDFSDSYELSTHEKDFRRRADLATELSCVAKRLQELENVLRAPDNVVKLHWHSDDPGFGVGQSYAAKNFRQLYYILGNHEARMTRTLARDPLRGALNTYMSAGMLQQRTLTQAITHCATDGYSADDWTTVAYMHYLRVGDLVLTHDVGRAGQTAHMDAARVHGSAHVVIGHTHRLATATHHVSRATYTSHMLGWLGDSRQQGYMTAARMAREWCAGFGVATVEASSGRTWVEAIPIQRDAAGLMRACVGGRVVGAG